MQQREFRLPAQCQEQLLDLGLDLAGPQPETVADAFHRRLVTEMDRHLATDHVRRSLAHPGIGDTRQSRSVIETGHRDAPSLERAWPISPRRWARDQLPHIVVNNTGPTICERPSSTFIDLQR
jgi:hypothetical protein